MTTTTASAAVRIDVQDLLLRPARIPWLAGGRDVAVGLDCYGLAVLVLRRRWPDVPEVVLDPWTAGTREALDDYLARFATRWQRLGSEVWRAASAGDVIVTPGTTGPHVSVLVDAAAGRVITTSQLTGVVSVKRDHLRDSTDVLRFLPAGGDP